MKIFMDTEFTSLSKEAELISIGLVSVDGRTFYAELTDYDKGKVNDWVKENVIDNLLFIEDDYCVSAKHLVKDSIINEDSDEEVTLSYCCGFDTEMKGDKKAVAKELKRWLEQFKDVQIWSDCLAYDWVLFVDLFGTAFDLPENVSYIPLDICTMFEMKYIDPDISREAFINNVVVGTKHNALYDAMVIRECYKKLLNIHL